jgi:hypothetical protein
MGVFRLPMKKLSCALILGGLLVALPLRAVYAPIPEQDQGKDLMVNVRAGISYDSNLFGSSTGAVDSIIYTIAPRIAYNRSLTDQTFFSAGYGLTVDHFADRPGDKTLDSHDASLRLAHAFSKSTTIDINELFMVSRNPESLLPGVATIVPRVINPDQSFTRNQLDGRFVTPLSPKSTATVKARSVYFDYRNDVLGRSLDRIENLYGLAADYAVLPELKTVAEYRHLDVFYRKQGELKNKNSEYLMGGIDYAVARKLSVSSRLGVEWRQRAAERDTTAPFAEASAKYDYTEKSFLVGGLGYSIEETSDTLRFNDTKVKRAFINVQHAVSALIVASGSATYEPSTLQGRRGIRNVDETTTRLGGALSYLPTKNWTLSGSADYDRVRSDDPQRSLKRKRAGLYATYSF